MKKIALLFACAFLGGCTATHEVVDMDLFKNELNEAILEFQTELGVPKEDIYQIK